MIHMILTPVIELAAIAVGYALFSIVLQRKIVNIDKMYEIRARMNEHQNALMALIKSNADKEAISQKQKDVMNVSTESMKQVYKPMIVILPLYALLYYLLLPKLFNMSATLNILSFTLSYHLFFVALTVIIGLIISQIFTFSDKRRLKDKYNFGLMQLSFKNKEVQPQ